MVGQLNSPTVERPTAVTGRRRWSKWIAVTTAAGAALFAIANVLSGTPPVPAPSQADIFVVSTRPLTSVVVVPGTIGPGASRAVTAPFDGVIRSRSTVFGQAVTAGTPLLEMATDELESRAREAAMALLKAETSVRALTGWSDSLDVVRARRTVEQAKASLADLERQVGEVKELLDRGIVSRKEFEGVVQLKLNQEAALTTSEEDLQAVLARGNADNRRLAELELQIAKSRAEDIQQQLAASIVRSPSDGILLQPPAGTVQGQSTSIETGARVARGQTLFRIAPIGSFTVSSKVDERDVVKLRTGMPVEIASDTLPGQALAGRIESIGTEAAADSDTRSPRFNVVAAVDPLKSAQIDAIRIGMSVRMTITTYSRATAIVVPIGAVWNVRGTAAVVSVRKRLSDETFDAQIALGVTTIDGIEVTAGLSEGDEIVLPNQTSGEPLQAPKTR